MPTKQTIKQKKTGTRINKGKICQKWHKWNNLKKITKEKFTLDLLPPTPFSLRQTNRGTVKKTMAVFLETQTS